MVRKGRLASTLKTVRDKMPFQRQIYTALRSFNPPERLYQHLPVAGWIWVKTDRGQFRMFSDGDIVENSLFWSRDGRGEDAISFRIWERIAASTDGAILDIGANTGLYALIAKTARPIAVVMAFEPVRQIAEKLSRNIAGNSYDIAVMKKAVSDRNGIATFHDSADAESSGNRYSASLENTFAFNDHSYEVEVVAIDSLFSADRKVSLIKIDVELHEVSALRGMLKMVERDRPAILVEVINDEIADRLSEMLKPLGYVFFSIEEQAGMHPVDGLRPLPGHNYNNLACQPGLITAAGLQDLIVATTARAASR